MTDTQPLVSSLLINDRAEVYDGREPAVSPREAIEKLVQMGRSASPALAPFIEKYEKEQKGRYYIEYVVEVLGRIGGANSVELILRTLRVSCDDDDSISACVKSLQTLGKTATPAIVSFVEENYKDPSAVISATEAMEKIVDPRLVPLLVKLLKYPEPLVIQSALISLRIQDNKSAVPHIIPLLQYTHEHSGEQEEVRERALSALEELLRKDQPLLRKTLMDSGVLSFESLHELSRKLAVEMDSLAGACRKELIFEGDEGEQLTALLKERMAKMALSSVLRGAARAAYHEALIPHSEFRIILERCESLAQQANDIKWKAAEAVWLSGFDEGLLGVTVAKMEARQVKGCYPMPTSVKERVHSLLRSKGFAVSERHGSILARSESGGKSVIITSNVAEGRRVWADVRIRLCRDWDEDEVAPMLKHLWGTINPRPMRTKPNSEPNQKARRPNRSYLIGFVKKGKLQDVHVSDDVKEHSTWEYIFDSFSLADIMLIWPRPARRFRNKEPEQLLKYVRRDMQDDCDDLGKKPSEAIEMKLVGGGCLVIGWTPIKLPKGYSSWDELTDAVAVGVLEAVRKMAEAENSQHDLRLRLYDSRLPLSSEEQLKERYALRSRPYERCNIPTDEVLREYLDLIRNSKYEQAGKMLSEFYGIDPPNVYAGTNLPGQMYVFYDLAHRTVMISPERIPEIWQQVPAFLMGFFLHLSNSKDWSFSTDIEESGSMERAEAENFAGRVVHRLIDIGLNPRHINGK